MVLYGIEVERGVPTLETVEVIKETKVFYQIRHGRSMTGYLQRIPKVYAHLTPLDAWDNYCERLLFQINTKETDLKRLYYLLDQSKEQRENV